VILALAALLASALGRADNSIKRAALTRRVARRLRITASSAQR